MVGTILYLHVTELAKLILGRAEGYRVNDVIGSLIYSAISITSNLVIAIAVAQDTSHRFKHPTAGKRPEFHFQAPHVRRTVAQKGKTRPLLSVVVRHTRCSDVIFVGDVVASSCCRADYDDQSHCEACPKHPRGQAADSSLGARFVGSARVGRDGLVFVVFGLREMERLRHRSHVRNDMV